MRNDGSGKARIQEGSRFKEELREVNISGGLEYNLADHFFARSGFFYEDPNKGGRQYLMLGTAGSFKWITLDISYLLPLDEESPLANTVRFSIGVDF